MDTKDFLNDITVDHKDMSRMAGEVPSYPEHVMAHVAKKSSIKSTKSPYKKDKNRKRAKQAKQARKKQRRK